MKRREFFAFVSGAAAAWPLSARGQQDERLQELGWTNGGNVQFDFRFGDADATRTSMLATELIELRPDVVLAAGAPAAIALREHTLSIPIVFVQVVDPVSAGFVTNLARPEGNITGFTNFEFSVGGKWLQLLKECAPSVDRIAVVFDPANPTWTAYLRTIEAAAPSFGLRLIPAGVRDTAEIAQRIATFARDPNGALVVLPSPVTISHRETIIVAAAIACPRSIHTVSSLQWGLNVLWVGSGVLIQAWGVIRRSNPQGSEGSRVTRAAADQVRADVNVKTAKALGVIIPPGVLAIADEVIE
jgi:putative ABC transport system substrate-binding protein